MDKGVMRNAVRNFDWRNMLANLVNALPVIKYLE